MTIVLINIIDKNKFVSFLVLLLFTLLVFFTRYNQKDISLIKATSGVNFEKGENIIDIQGYIKLTDYFKGNLAKDSLIKPFSYRILNPFLASKLSFKSIESINIINLLAVLLSVLMAILTLLKLNYNFSVAILSTLLSVLSFPLLYYSSTGRIDVTAIFFIYLTVYILTIERYYFLIPISILLAFAKETNVIVFPYAFIHIYIFSKSKFRDFAYLVLSILIFLFALYYVRLNFNPDSSTYSWVPDMVTLKSNVFRIRSYISFALSFGLIGTICTVEILKKGVFIKENLLYTYSLVAGICLTFYSVIAAYTDGRYFWIVYPMLIPIVARYINNKTKIK